MPQKDITKKKCIRGPPDGEKKIFGNSDPLILQVMIRVGRAFSEIIRRSISFTCPRYNKKSKTELGSERFPLLEICYLVFQDTPKGFYNTPSLETFRGVCTDTLETFGCFGLIKERGEVHLLQGF